MMRLMTAHGTHRYRFSDFWLNTNRRKPICMERTWSTRFLVFCMVVRKHTSSNRHASFPYPVHPFSLSPTLPFEEATRNCGHFLKRNCRLLEAKIKVEQNGGTSEHLQHLIISHLTTCRPCCRRSWPRLRCHQDPACHRRQAWSRCRW